ncbi:MAG: NAD(P)/FAD-dependent oxidoreductase [Clostridia bacterium]|nr:NAD(P)/FAD-dependent oxidoreductase [Clostridia bacterium]
MSDRYDVIVIGAGASGMMAAAEAALCGAKTLVLERNEKPGRKIAITGKGRCNITNDCDSDTFFGSVSRNPRFLYSAYSRFNSQDTIAFFENLGVPLKRERGNRVFPVSDKAFDIVDALKKNMLDNGVRFRPDERVNELLIENNRIKGVKTQSGKSFEAASVVVACGGISYPTTGSDGDGYELAVSAGHTLKSPRPSLCGIDTSDDWTGELAGLSLKNVTLCVQNRKFHYREMGEMLFTHSGISGPLVLTLTSCLQDEQLEMLSCSIDLKPALDEEKLDRSILRRIETNQRIQMSTFAASLLPSRMADLTLKILGIPGDKNVSQLKKEERSSLVKLLKGFPIHLKSFRPIEEAIVTRGGVLVKEIDPATMESKICEGLFFAGEIIDVDAKTGGFNLQIALCTGKAAGEGAALRAKS